jgi:hypothetical protein
MARLRFRERKNDAAPAPTPIHKPIVDYFYKLSHKLRYGFSDFKKLILPIANIRNANFNSLMSFSQNYSALSHSKNHFKKEYTQFLEHLGGGG